MSAGGWWYERLAAGTVNPADYDGVEVQPCRSFTEDNGTDTYVEPCEPADAEFWSAYVHCKAGGVECIGDFDTEDAAAEYARKVAKEQGYVRAFGVAL